MTAHKEQDERVVLLRLTFKLVDLHRRGGFPAAAGQLAAQVIGHAPGGDLNQPGARIVGKAFPRPLQGGCDQCLLNGVLGVGEVTEAADDRAEHLRRKLAQQMLGCVKRAHSKSSGGPLMTCRTSIGMLIGGPPGPGAADARAAIS